tara:strand:+ start:222 stop:788 length:567 start_codon:yes stop_codon:yes gene_type:complete
MKSIEIIDNFFDSFDNIKEAFKSIPLYEADEYRKRNSVLPEDKELLNKSTFPGKRSDALHRSHPFLFNLILKEIFYKIKEGGYSQIKLDCSVHLRLAKDNADDFIHVDPALLMVVYLSETNLKSGTAFYEKGSNKPCFIQPFIQNTAVFFPGYIRHRSWLNYGTNIDNGRLILNGFIYEFNNQKWIHR